MTSSAASTSAGKKGKKKQVPPSAPSSLPGELRVSSTFPTERVLAVWCPDWPVLAAGGEPGVAGAVIEKGRIFVCTPAARAAGVRRGQRLRDAQARCPWLRLYPRDPMRDTRLFEAVVACVAEVVADPEVVYPGLLVAPARGAARYHGGELPLTRIIIERVTGRLGYPVRCGISDGFFSAVQAAYSGRIVPVGESAAFLAELPVSRLGDGGAAVLTRLGLRTLGEFAALPRNVVASRWGEQLALAHDLASGKPARFFPAAKGMSAVTVERDLDPPIDRVDGASFVARSLAEELHGMLRRRGLGCTRVVVEARAEDGAVRSRVWRSVDARVLSVGAMVDRVRWQVAGWLESGELRSGLVWLRLVADETVLDAGRQLSLWGERGGEGDRRSRISQVLSRLEGMLGPDGVLVGVLGGGRDPISRVRWLPWNSGIEGKSPDSAAPWPGSLPSPSPSTVWDPPRRAVVSTAAGEIVRVDGRLRLSGSPQWFSFEGESFPVTAWAGPWPFDERWWDAGSARRGVRLQLVTADGMAWLVSSRNGGWVAEGRYD